MAEDRHEFASTLLAHSSMDCTEHLYRHAFFSLFTLVASSTHFVRLVGYAVFVAVVVIVVTVTGVKSRHAFFDTWTASALPTCGLSAAL